MLGILGLVVRLLVLQIIDAPRLQSMAQAQHTVSVSPFIPRYPIVDRSGTVLAIDQLVYSLYAHPNLFNKEAAEVAATLAPLLERPSSELVAAFDEQDSGIRLVDEMPEDLADRVIEVVTEFGLDGIELVPQPQRMYPQNDLFAEVIGFVNVDRTGQAGVEYSQNEILSRPPQTATLTRSGNGAIMPDDVPSWLLQTQADLSLRLTVDRHLQRAVRQLLKAQVEQYSATQATAIVMDVRDGAILALVDEPSYNPNEYYRHKVEDLGVWAISGLYEPGSTFKPLNVAIALEAGAIQPSDSFYDEGRIEVGGWPIENSDYEYVGARGDLSVTDILKYSSNVGMIRMMQQLDPSIYYDWLIKLGIGELTGIDLPFEAQGQFKDRNQFIGASVEPATAAFGQGFSLTPMQLIQLHATLANNGMMPIPHVVQGLYDNDGELQWQPDRPDEKSIFSPEVTQIVLKMMEEIVTDGTGEAAQIPGYRIAGKTGTAQKVSDQGGYADTDVIASFISILPIESPRYAILVVIDEPKGGEIFGSTVAAPVAKGIMEVLIGMENLRPTQPIPSQPNSNGAIAPSSDDDQINPPMDNAEFSTDAEATEPEFYDTTTDGDETETTNPEVDDLFPAESGAESDSLMPFDDSSDAPVEP
jgi:cell division protein FtsI (penicillin-binding protein 3)